MRWALLVLLGLGGAASAEEPGPRCDFPAVLAGDDAGDLAIYEGLRLGLEKAHLPRVCLEEAAPADLDAALRAKGAAARARGDPPPVAFGVGAGAATLVGRHEGPTVVAAAQYTRGGVPLDWPLPAAGARRSVVLLSIPTERVRTTLAALTGREIPPLLVPADMGADGRTRFVVPETEVVLHLSLGGPRPDFRQALARAREHGVPLVSDDRARFGQGATVVIVPDHEQAGRVAADLARELYRDPEAKGRTKIVRSFQVWVDLAAADRQGLELPLAFVASAHKLRPGRRRPRGAAR